MVHVDYHVHFIRHEVIFKYDSLVNVSLQFNFLFINETSISLGRDINHLSPKIAHKGKDKGACTFCSQNEYPCLA